MTRKKFKELKKIIKNEDFILYYSEIDEFIKISLCYSAMMNGELSEKTYNETECFFPATEEEARQYLHSEEFGDDYKYLYDGYKIIKEAYKNNKSQSETAEILTDLLVDNGWTL